MLMPLLSIVMEILEKKHIEGIRTTANFFSQ